MEFRSTDVRRLKRAMNTVKDKRTYVRLQAVCWAVQGQSVVVVASQINKSRRVVYNWVKKFLKTRDPFCLCDEQRSGRPVSAPSITEKRILAALTKAPRSLGYAVNAWTVESLAHYMNERYGTNIAPHTLRRRMKQMGLRYKRPRYVYEEKDPHVAQKKGPLSES